MTRLYHRRYPPLGGYALEQARELAALSFGVGRQVGLLLDRQGRTEMVIVGDPKSILIPDLSRARVSPGRLRGLRLLHTHLGPEPLTQEDLMDMLFLRLDSLAALCVDQDGSPATFHHAHLLPANPGNQPYEVAPALPWDRVDVDFTALAQSLEEEFSRTGRIEAAGVAPPQGTPALLVAVSSQSWRAMEASLAELAELARTAGLFVAGTVLQRVAQVNPKHILGKGKLAELEVKALQANAQLLVFDRELTPAQMRNLADLTERKIMDRTQLILDIFAQRARSRAGRLQVEAAQLAYTLPRLVGRGKALSRLMGGIGGRGPGESKLETDRRKIRERMARLSKELDELRRQRGHARARRAKARVPVAALVGYTNAGKSTLLNVLTHAQVLAEDKLFATLDPTTRRLRFPHERELILTDTVGFIRSLPEELKEAFRATLEELESADLLIHVCDASHPEFMEQNQAVEDILADLGLGDTSRLRLLNKWDRLDPEAREAALHLLPDSIPVSALTGEGLEELSRRIASRIDWERHLRPQSVAVPDPDPDSALDQD